MDKQNNDYFRNFNPYFIIIFARVKSGLFKNDINFALNNKWQAANVEKMNQ
jgi:hypothetical protein